jgi:hypothetical protein
MNILFATQYEIAPSPNSKWILRISVLTFGYEFGEGWGGVENGSNA